MARLLNNLANAQLVLSLVKAAPHLGMSPNNSVRYSTTPFQHVRIVFVTKTLTRYIGRPESEPMRIRSRTGPFDIFSFPISTCTKDPTTHMFNLVESTTDPFACKLLNCWLARGIHDVIGAEGQGCSLGKENRIFVRRLTLGVRLRLSK
jgi:hypothetical protein